MANKQLHKIEFDDAEIDAIVAMGFEPFEPDPTEEMPASQLAAIADMALGKAERLRKGLYSFDGDQQKIDQKATLRQVAAKICRHLNPGLPLLEEPRRSLDFGSDLCEEVDAIVQSLDYDDADREDGEPHNLTRSQWNCVGLFAIGKAVRVRNGDYGGEDPDEGFDPEVWSSSLLQIGERIFGHFQPGDGKI